ncbi:WD40 repeat domain-containing protein [Streptosporangiaceae bacterium NEAU-GS5]|nr:WD40 repeat domain-containing protein [Streptosporangiaceae bacterium NEAU-GS5]
MNGDRRALLIGTADHTDRRLPSVRAVENSLDGMRRILVDPSLCGWQDEQVIVRRNPVKVVPLLKEIRQLAADAHGVLLLYFAGHGKVLRNGDLSLLLTSTDVDMLEETALNYRRIRESLQDSPAMVKIVILDCCYSGRAVEALAAGEITEYVGTRGVITLTASYGDKTAHVVEPGAQATAMTSFTGQFVDLIQDGLPGESTWLTITELYPALRERLRSRGLPLPDRMITDMADRFPFTRNAATDAAADHDGVPPRRSVTLAPSPRTGGKRRPAVSRRRILMGGGALGAAALAGGGWAVWRSFNHAEPPVTPIPSGGVALGTALSGHTKGVWDVAIGEGLNGAPIAVSGGEDKTVRIWDLRTRRPVGEPLRGHTGGVWGVGLSRLDGVPVLVSGSVDQTVRVWDLSASPPRGIVLHGHKDTIKAIAMGEYDGRQVAFSGSEDHTVRVWDLRSRRQLGKPITFPDKVIALASGRVNGHDILLAGCLDHTLQVWDLTAGRPRYAPLIGHGDPVEAVAMTDLGGKPVAITGGPDKTVRVWDLAAGVQLGSPLIGHTDWVWGVAAGTLDGHTVALSVGDGIGRLWDLTEGGRLARQLPDQNTSVWAVALGDVLGTTVAVTGNLNGTVELWDLHRG